MACLPSVMIVKVNHLSSKQKQALRMGIKSKRDEFSTYVGYKDMKGLAPQPANAFIESADVRENP